MATIITHICDVCQGEFTANIGMKQFVFGEVNTTYARNPTTNVFVLVDGYTVKDICPICIKGYNPLK